MRSSAGEKVGQLPVPRSVMRRPAFARLDRLQVRQAHWVPGVASKRIRRPSCDQVDEPQWVSFGCRLVGDQGHFPVREIQHVESVPIRGRLGLDGMSPELLDESGDGLRGGLSGSLRLRWGRLRSPRCAGLLGLHLPRCGQDERGG